MEARSERLATLVNCQPRKVVAESRKAATAGACRNRQSIGLTHLEVNKPVAEPDQTDQGGLVAIQAECPISLGSTFNSVLEAMIDQFVRR